MTLLLIFTSDLPLAVSVFMGLGGALLFGLLWTLGFRRAIDRLMDRLYDGAPDVVPAPPTGEYRVRVLASLMTSPAFAVGGHLYLGESGVAFVPHLKNRPSDRAARSASWTSVVKLETWEQRAPFIVRAITSSQQSYLRIVAHGEPWLLRVPEAETVRAELERWQTSTRPAV
jgi:hypothetical protein